MRINQEQLKREKENRVLKSGDYKFEVISAEERASLKSSDGKMTVLKLAVYDDNDRKYTIKDWLGLWEFGAIKAEAFFESIGMSDLYAKGEDIDPYDLIGKTGMVHTKVGEYQGEPKAQVAWYIPNRDGKIITVPKPQTVPVMAVEDDMPF